MNESFAAFLIDYLARAGCGGRRQAARLLAAGRVKVNGQTVTTGEFEVVHGRDYVRVDDKLIKKVFPPTYIVLNKPERTITATSDPGDRRTVYALLGKYASAVTAVGRLDWNTEGALLFTNDGALAHALTAPASHVPKIYRVKIKGHATPAELERLRRGVDLGGFRTAPAVVRVVSTEPSNMWLRLTLTEGKYHQVKRMVEVIGHVALKLVREKFGPVEIGGLAVGRWRHLHDWEIRELREMATRAAGAPPAPPRRARQAARRPAPRPASRAPARAARRPSGEAGAFGNDGAAMKKRWWLLGAFALLAALAVWRLHGRRLTPAAPLAPISEPIALPNINPYLAMFTYVRAALATYPDVKKALELPIDADLPDLCDRPTIVSIYRENSPPLWGVGVKNCLAALGQKPRNQCFADELLCAAYQVTEQKAFKKDYLLKLDQVAVRIDVVNNLRPLQVGKNDVRRDLIEPGVNGLILQNGPHLTFQPPFAYLIYSWEREGDPRRADRMTRQLENLARDARVGAGNWWKYPLYRFTTHSTLQMRPDFLPLLVLRDAPIIRRFGSADIGRAAIDAGRHLLKAFDMAQKHFRQQYNPITQDKGGWLSYNVIDHAGVVYSLFKLFKASHKEEFLPVGQAALDFLVRHIEPPLLEPETLAVERYQNAPLGATALMLLGATEMPDRLRRKIGVDRINRLARFLVEMQETDGRFYDFYWQRLLGYRARRPIAPFSGEALLALVRYFKINANYEWFNAARAAAKQQMARFDNDHQVDPWSMTGLAELYDVDPQKRYAEVVFEMADELLRKQWGSADFDRPPFPDYAGGFAYDWPPQTLTAAAELEGLLAAHWLAYKTGRDTQPYADGVLGATHYLLLNQYRRDNTYYVNRPEETRGGFRNSLIDPLIRMENDQHAILALIGAYDIAVMRETGAVPTEFKAEGSRELEDKMEIGGKVQ